MADDVSDVVWPRGIFEATGGHHQKEHKKLRSYISMTFIIMANYRYEHNQLVERHPKVTLHSWGLFLCSASGLAALSREIYGYRRRRNIHPQHPRITNFEEKGCSLIVDNVRWVGLLYSLFRLTNVNVILVFSC